MSPFRHSRGGGNPARKFLRAALYRHWVPAFAGMTILLAVVGSPLAAQDTMPPAPYAYAQLEDPAQEAQAKALMETLRCLKCQGQSIADSDASMAGDMRHQVRTRIAAGESPEAIRAWMIERYGEYVSYKPELGAATWPLFALPLLLLVIAGLVFRTRFGRKSA